MRGKITFSKYLIVSIIILAVGVPTAYGITITLAGDPVIINGILDMMNNRITNVGTPTASTDAATKSYVDSAPSTDTLALLGCTDTQIAQFVTIEDVSSGWTCVDLGPAIGVQGFYIGEPTLCDILSTDVQKVCLVSCDSGDVLVNIGGIDDHPFTDITRIGSSFGGTPPSSGSVTYNNPLGEVVSGTLLPMCADFDPAHVP